MLKKDVSALNSTGTCRPVANLSGDLLKSKTTLFGDFKNRELYTQEYFPIEHLLYDIDDCLVDARTGTFVSDFAKVSETNSAFIDDMWSTISIEHVDLSYESEIVFFAFNVWWSNYYHWLLQIVPAIHWYLNSEKNKKCKIALPDYMHDKHKWMITQLGLDENRVIYIRQDKGKFYKFKRASFLDVLDAWPLNGYSPFVYNQFHSRSDCYTAGASKGKHIYISRQDTPHRRIVNEDVLIRAMQEEGYEILTLGNMSLPEIIGAFSHARQVVGPHGAGLSNVIWSKPGTVLLEIVFPDYESLAFVNLARSAGIDINLVSMSTKYQADTASDSLYECNVELIRSVVSQIKSKL